MIRVLFVCLGNICRSPMAEAVFKDLLRKESLADQFSVDSAGLGRWHVGEKPHRGTLAILAENNISSEGITARQIDASDLEKFDYIIVMDDENKKGINGWKKSSNARIYKLLDFVSESKGQDVPDPYYTGNFQEVYQLIEQGCHELLKYIREKERI
ncbi:low molecular weight protein-tyrosine-phosphatase [Bacillus kwashiorkori]|uniref:low molecular weight protein-tyrosine-phosphatase n=1 Tax=Bacillus kwashiorkori TaxID=1522318 RepID=UPI00078156F7|nr:low molecular weight protein-tyrosine-phosphatase [Bacillus kwashiorkori]